MSKELAKKANGEMAVFEGDQADWGADAVGNKEMLMPRLALMAGTSGLVEKDKAQIGDIVNTASEKILAKKGEGLEIIPVKMLPKTYVISKDGKWVRTELAKDTDEEREWEIDGEKHERCLNFYVLVRKEIAEGDALPYLLSFKGTAIKGGRKLVNHFKMSQAMKKAPARNVFKLSSEKKSNDKNTWNVWAIDEVGDTTEVELKKSYEWLLSLKALSDNLVTKYEQEGATGSHEETAAEPIQKGEVRNDARF